MELSPRLQNLKPSATIAMSVKARELRSQGRDIISLSLGEPDFQTPEFIKEAAIQAIKENYNHYTPVGGYLELKEAISRKFKRDNNLDYSTSQIVVSTGAKQSIFNIIQCLVGEGDEVILPSPYWVSYADMVSLAGGTVVQFNTGVAQNFKMTPAQLEEVITPKTKVILYSSPCNPSGSVYSKEELAGIAEVIARHPNILVISDEIYEHITFEEPATSLAAFPEIYNQVATVNGLAKGFAMTGWRIGYMGAPTWLARACEVFQGQVTSGTNSIAQRAAITAMNADPAEIKYMTKAFQERRDIVVGLAREIEGFEVSVPKGAFYIFPDVSQLFGRIFQGIEINSANDLALYLLEYANVATVSGESFGSPKCLRISYASSEKDLRTAFERIKKAINNH